MNSRMIPSRTQWMKLSDCGGMILEEQPAKLAEAIRLFLQGQGYGEHYTPPLPTLYPTPIHLIEAIRHFLQGQGYCEHHTPPLPTLYPTPIHLIEAIRLFLQGRDMVSITPLPYLPSTPPLSTL